MKNDPLISVIILSYKNQVYIFDTINSVLMQDYSNIELIITDDGTEGFDKELYIDYIMKNKRENITNLIVHKNEVNLGLVKNSNIAVKMSKGNYIKFIAADDAFYDSAVISSFVNFFINTGALIAASRMVCCDEKLMPNGRKFSMFEMMPKYLTELSPMQCYIQLSKIYFIPIVGVCYTRQLFERYGLFDERYNLVEDRPMLLKISRNNCKIRFLDIVSVKYRLVGMSNIMSPLTQVLDEDIKRCFDLEIRPYKCIFGFWQYKKLVYEHVKQYEYKNYSSSNRTKFMLRNLDITIFHVFPRGTKRLIRRIYKKVFRKYK